MEQQLSLYKIFYTVAREKNISRAASALYISQPAISKSIRKLEESLNTVLFLRGSRGVQLTEEGKLLFQYVKSAFDTLQTGEEQLRQMTELGIGHLRIGVSTTLCKYMLLPYLQRFVALYPNIRISIECQSSNHTLQLLNERRIDIGFIGKPASVGNILFSPLGEIEDIFVATKTYIDNLSRRNPGSSLFPSATLMLLDKENMTRQYIDDYLKEQRIEPGNLLEVTTMDLLIEFAKISLGIACVIRQFVQPELDTGALLEIPLGFPIHKREVGLACLNARQYSHAMQAFMDFSMKTNG